MQSSAELWEQCWLNLQPTCYQCSSYKLYGRALMKWKSSFQDVFNLIRLLGKWPPKKSFELILKPASFISCWWSVVTTISTKLTFLGEKTWLGKYEHRNLKANLSFTYEETKRYFYAYLHFQQSLAKSMCWENVKRRIVPRHKLSISGKKTHTGKFWHTLSALALTLGNCKR